MINNSHKSTKKEIIHLVAVFLAIFAFIFVLFLRFPLNDSLFGNIDIWFYVWQMNDFYNHYLGNAPSGQILYPSEDIVSIMESPLGIGLLYSPFKIFIKNDIWTFYLLSCSTLSLNGVSFYLLLKSFSIEKWIAIAMAFLFATNNFAFSNVENFNAFVIFPGLLAAYSLKRAVFCKQLSLNYTLLAAFIAGIQLYFSMYFFVFQFIIIGVIALFYWNKLPKIQYILSGFVLLILLMLPFVLQHQGLPNYLDKYDLLANASIHNEAHSINLFKDFFRADPGNILYPAFSDIENPWRYAARSGFFGISTYLLIIAAIFYLFKNGMKKPLFLSLAIIVIAILVSTGPFLKTNFYQIKTPIGWINEWFAKTNAFRHFFRAHLVTIAGSLLLIAFMLNDLWKKNNSNSKILLLVFSIIFMLENLPLKGELFPSKQYLQPSKELYHALDGITEDSNLFFLPSCHQITDERVVAKPINQINREFIYATWKNYLPYNIYNGRLSYVTDEAYENSRFTCKMDSLDLSTLLSSNEIDAFVVSHDFLEKEDEALINVLASQLVKINANSQYSVYSKKE